LQRQQQQQQLMDGVWHSYVMTVDTLVYLLTAICISVPCILKPKTHGM